MKNGDLVHIDAFCSACEAAYYRSVKPLVVGRDQIRPELFVPITAGTPPPNPEKPVCPTCESPLRFIASATTPAPMQDASEEEPRRRSPVAQSVERPAVNREAGGSRPSRGASAVIETLFEILPDEQVLDMKAVDDSYIVVTNKRIVRVSL